MFDKKGKAVPAPWFTLGKAGGENGGTVTNRALGTGEKCVGWTRGICVADKMLSVLRGTS